MTNAPKATVAAMLAVALSAAPLAACAGQAGQGERTDPAAGQAQAASVDVSSWKTLGDALAYDAGENNTASWDEEHYITVFTTTDGSIVRVVATMDEATYDAHADLDMSSDDYHEKFLEVMGGLPLERAENLTDQKLTQEEMESYVGKTGQDLVADGFAFQYYWMYGSDETGATMVKDQLAYDVTFDVTISDDEADTDEEGAAIMEATIVSMEFDGASNDAADPTEI